MSLIATAIFCISGSLGSLICTEETHHIYYKLPYSRTPLVRAPLVRGPPRARFLRANIFIPSLFNRNIFLLLLWIKYHFICMEQHKNVVGSSCEDCASTCGAALPLFHSFMKVLGWSTSFQSLGGCLPRARTPLVRGFGGIFSSSRKPRTREGRLYIINCHIL